MRLRGVLNELRTVWLTAAVLTCFAPRDTFAAEKPDAFTVPAKVNESFNSHCLDCHSGATAKGQVDFTRLGSMALNERLDLLNRIQEQLFFGMMPPAKADPLAKEDARHMAEWVRTELRSHKASKLDDKLPYPDAGNYVDHVTLLGGTIREKPFTPGRRWIVSPQIFEERVLDVFKLDGKERENIKRSGFFGVTNPFVLPDHAGVRDYDLGSLNGGHLLVMKTNAEWISTKQLLPALIKAGAAQAKPNTPKEKDRWMPKATAPAFEAVLLNKGVPIDDELRAAVRTQFDCVLQRTPNDGELQKYTAFTRAAVTLAGNTEGLRQMLMAVLLESEFVYRLEFGAGPQDEQGRQKLAPREAAYAISYALGDRGPDAKLLTAAREGRLETKADYEREVLRLLADNTYFAGTVDKSLGLNNAVTATHPRTLRFFREFFGYPMAVKVFKDTKRSDGIYQNPDRGSTNTPGYLINEADMLVKWVLNTDKSVFETLLTTDQNFMYHNVDNEKGLQQIEKWKKAYEILKETDWKKNPEKVVVDHDATIRKYLDPKGLPAKNKVNHDNSLLRFMNYFEHTFGQGRKPFTITPWSFGNRYIYSPFYSLPNTPKTPGRDGKYSEEDALDYQPIQPFAIPNHKGILTHPAWLIAFSSNFHNDPVRRGRWIREKLLAGYVPDVPITVDAKVPDDPHHTFRERLEMATKSSQCMKCHQHMNALGVPFEAYDDFGRFRKVESLEHPDNLIKTSSKNGTDEYKTKPVTTTGHLHGTGDATLDGDVSDPFDLIDRLARSDRVRQSIIRHAFRFYLGRNETLADSQTIIDADKAYVKSGGSFRAVIVSLLTSDSFIYRKTQGKTP
ncbi:hypothetical protein BH11PLA2_BH11PLA2_20470 [soil metagenome]